MKLLLLYYDYRNRIKQTHGCALMKLEIYLNYYLVLLLFLLLELLLLLLLLNYGPGIFLDGDIRRQI